MKQMRTEVEGSRKKRIYDNAQTPFGRLKTSAGADPERIKELEKLKAALNPFELKRSIEKKLRRVLRTTGKASQKAVA